MQTQSNTVFSSCKTARPCKALQRLFAVQSPPQPTVSCCVLAIALWHDNAITLLLLPKTLIMVFLALAACGIVLQAFIFALLKGQAAIHGILAIYDLGTVAFVALLRNSSQLWEWRQQIAEITSEASTFVQGTAMLRDLMNIKNIHTLEHMNVHQMSFIVKLYKHWGAFHLFQVRIFIVTGTWGLCQRLFQPLRSLCIYITSLWNYRWMSRIKFQYI